MPRAAKRTSRKPASGRPPAVQLLKELRKAPDLDSALTLIKQLEKYHGFRWRAVGDRENNFGTINMGSDPGDALVERVTNAIDAVIEKYALTAAKQRKKDEPGSPREAVETWCGVQGGRVVNLPKDERRRLAKNVQVQILDGKTRRNPTVKIRDFGIGLTPEQIPDTILSLGADNKIGKPYLAGAYGQGGSTALAFSPHGTLIISRRFPDLLSKSEKDRVSVTFARFNPLDPTENKNGRYEYLVDADRNIASFSAGKESASEAGTTVVHYNMQIDKYSQRITQPTGSLWWLFQNALFDPVLPLWLVESREKFLREGRSDGRTINGNYTRLVSNPKNKVEHRGNVRVHVEHSSGRNTVQANFWILKHDDDNVRPIEAYVDTHRPIVYTYFGQRHHVDDSRYIRDRLGLPYLLNYLIVQVELDELEAPSRRELFSTTRDRLRQTPFFEQIRERVLAALSEDPELVRLNEHRKEQALSKHSERERTKIRKRFAELMRRLQAGTDVKARGRGDDLGKSQTDTVKIRHAPLAPLKTRKVPTYIEIVNRLKPIPARVGRHCILQLESDAPDDYVIKHAHAKLTIACEPEDLLVEHHQTDFSGGRARISVNPTPTAIVGKSGKVIVFLHTHTGKVLSASASIRIEEPKESSTAGGSGRAEVNVPEPIAVRKDEWSQHGWSQGSVAKVHEGERDTQIYVNVDNVHLTKLLHAGNYLQVGITRMRDNFLLYVAFYAWAQHCDNKKVSLDAEILDEYSEAELDRLAQTVVHSISATGRFTE